MSLETRAAVYALIKKRDITSSEIAEQLMIHKDTAREYVNDLLRANKVWTLKKTKAGFVMTAKQVKPIDMRILDHITKTPANAAVIAEHLGVDRSCVQKWLTAMKDAGAVRCVKTAKWEPSQWLVLNADRWISTRRSSTESATQVQTRNREAEAAELAPLWRGTAWQGLEAFV